jgi:hypothetical protein
MMAARLGAKLDSKVTREIAMKLIRMGLHSLLLFWLACAGPAG